MGPTEPSRPRYKLPESVLVVVHTAALDVLLIRRADADDYWQSVTGSKNTEDEAFHDTAVREVFEESGLVVEVFGFLADSKRSRSFTRYYLARRLAGTPAEMGWESQAVSLVPLAQLTAILNQPVDHPIVAALQARAGAWGTWFGVRGDSPR